ncbi:hypothetical protein N9896_03055 [bacterium]|nr:hypothetical protein [bacterium]
MKKFLFEIVLLFILVTITINYINNLDKPPRVKQILTIKEKLDIINLGTSHGSDFSYSGLSIHGASFNRAGNTLYYDLQNYKFIKNHLSDGAIILLPISYFSFGLDENRTDRGVDNPFVNEFYEYLPRKSIYSYSEKRAISLKINRIQKNFMNLFPKEKKKKKKKKKKSPLDTLSHEQMLKEFAIKRVVHHKKIGTYSNPDKNINYLKTLIDDAKQSGYHPILITTPFYKEYVEEFGADWLSKNYYQYLSLISKQYNIPYLDYGNENSISSKPELFKNSDHLNKKGISKFNVILFDDLVNLGMISEDDILQKNNK